MLTRFRPVILALELRFRDQLHLAVRELALPPVLALAAVLPGAAEFRLLLHFVVDLAERTPRGLLRFLDGLASEALLLALRHRVIAVAVAVASCRSWLPPVVGAGHVWVMVIVF